MISLSVFESSDDIAVYTFRLLTEAARAAGKIPAAAALSFGSTYEGIFKGWKNLYLNGIRPEVPPKPEMPAFFPADERRVGFDNPGSNWGTAWKTFLSVCGDEDDRIRWASDAGTYREFINEYFNLPKGEPDRKNRADLLLVFNLTFLGLGPDGHTASLFPGDCPEEDESGWYAPVLETKAPFDPPDRLTLGPEAIARSERLILTVTGGGKARIFRNFINELAEAKSKNDSRGLLPPVRIIRKRKSLGMTTEVLCDRAASAAIDHSLLDRITDRINI